MNMITAAWLFAIEKHVWDLKQKYGNIWPYSHHLEKVVEVLRRFGWGNDHEMTAAAICHDVVEDTRGKNNEVKVRDVAEIIGDEAAALVDAVTTPEGENRKVRNALAYPRIRAAGVRAVSLKLADRIANVEFGLNQGGGALKMYAKEHNDFRHGVYVNIAGDHPTEEEERMMSMWHYLNGIISDYREKHPGGDGK